MPSPQAVAFSDWSRIGQSCEAEAAITSAMGVSASAGIRSLRPAMRLTPCLVQDVAADEAGAAHLSGNDVVAAEFVVEGAAGEGFDFVVPVADARLEDVQRQDLQIQVGILRLRIGDADLPVIAGAAGDLFDARACKADVVAAFHVVVVVAALADQDVVARLLRIVQEEQVAGVTDQEVGLVAAFHPVVAAVAKDRVFALTGDRRSRRLRRRRFR